MKLKALILAAALLFGLCMGALFLFSFSSEEKSPKKILRLLPEENEMPAWKPLAEPETAEGEDLFLLINGGAEIYHEYGFKRAVIQSYENRDGLSLNIEIYEMENSCSAYGAFSFKTSGQGKKIDIGAGAVLEDYYLNFWKNNFVVTLIGFDESPSTKEALIEFARKVEPKIPDGGEAPPIMNFINSLQEEPFRKVYMEGNLALYNQYEFDTENIFGIKKGAAAYFEDKILFLLEYESEEEAQSWFEKACRRLRQNKRFHDFKISEEGASFRDNSEKYISASPFRNYILIYLGENASEAKQNLENLKQNIKKI